MSNTNLINTMRKVLVPKGSKPVVRLSLRNPAYFDAEFVQKCINRVEHAVNNRLALGEDMSPLEILAYHVLHDSVGSESEVDFKPPL